MLIKWRSLIAVIVLLQFVGAILKRKCSREKVAGIEWGAEFVGDTNISLSQPICFDDQYDIVYRECSNSDGWVPQIPPSCNLKSFTCPDGFEAIPGNAEQCFKITEPMQWNEEYCYGTDVTIFEVDNQQIFLRYLIETKNITEFWIPAKRFGNTFGPVVWRLTGDQWGEVLTEEKYDENSNGICVSVQIRSFRRNFSINLLMRNCDDELPMVCVHRFALTTLACPRKYFTLQHIPDKCFGVEKQENVQPNQTALTHDEFKEMQTNNIFIFITEYTYIDSSDLCLAYQYEVNESKKNIVMNNRGVLKPFDFYTCFVNRIQILPDHLPRMKLSFHSDRELITLTVYHRNRIWRQHGSYGISCFTNADYEQIRSVKIKSLLWENEAIGKSIFELKLHGDGPGYYWCEAHSIFNFELIQTQKVIAAKKEEGFVFAFFIELRCAVIECNNIHDNMKLYGKQIEKVLDDLRECYSRRRNNSFKNLVIYGVRVMNIEKFVPGTKMKFLCHVTASWRYIPRRHKKLYTSHKNCEYEFDANDLQNVTDDRDEGDDDDNDDDEDEAEEYLVAIQHDIQRNLTYLLKRSQYGYQNITFNSTEFCFPEFSESLRAKWQPARIGKQATTYEMCLLPNGLPVSRKCIGDFMYGATWETQNFNDKCFKISSGTEFITNELYDMIKLKLAKQSPSKAISGLKELFNKTRTNLIPADVFYLAKIMKVIERSVVKQPQGQLNSLNANRSSTTTNNINSITKTTFDIVTIYNYLMELNTSIAKPAAKLNSTNILLDAFERIIDRMSTTNDLISSDDSDINQDGIIYQITPRLMTFTIDPSVNNLTGVAIYTNNSELNDFRLCTHRFLYSNQSEDALLNEDNLEIATFVPEMLLQHLGEIRALTNETIANPRNMNPKIVIKFFINDRLFQEDRDFTDKKVLGKIVSISIPGYDTDLPDLLPVFVRTDGMEKNDTEADSCRYWNYDTWEDDGVESMKRSNSNQVIKCGSSHITPFAYLVGGFYNLSVSSDVVIITKLHEEALDMITVLGCSLSFVGILGIFITSIVFPQWREKPSSKILLQLSAAIGLQMILFCFVNTEVVTSRLIENHIYSSCVILGAFLHYSVLVQFSWMLIIAYLQYKRYVQVLGNTRPKRFFLKSFLLGWLTPLVPVICVITISPQAYIPFDNLDKSKICYPTGQALYFAIIAPISLIIIANLIIFILVIYHITRGLDGKVRLTDKQLALSQFRVSVLLFFLLGFTWIFGLLASFRAGILFSYLFCLTATLQGFILFIYFILLDPVTRKLWTNLIRKLFCKNELK